MEKTIVKNKKIFEDINSMWKNIFSNNDDEIDNNINEIKTEDEMLKLLFGNNNQYNKEEMKKNKEISKILYSAQKEVKDSEKNAIQTKLNNKTEKQNKINYNVKNIQIKDNNNNKEEKTRNEDDREIEK